MLQGEGYLLLNRNKALTM